jgi:hypothetical protein
MIGEMVGGIVAGIVSGIVSGISARILDGIRADSVGMGSGSFSLSAAHAGGEAIGIPARTMRRGTSEGNELEAIINQGTEGRTLGQ